MQIAITNIGFLGMFATLTFMLLHNKLRDMSFVELAWFTIFYPFFWGVFIYARFIKKLIRPNALPANEDPLSGSIDTVFGLITTVALLPIWIMLRDLLQ